MTKQWESVVLSADTAPTYRDILPDMERMIRDYKRPVERVVVMGPREWAWWRAHPDLARMAFGAEL